MTELAIAAGWFAVAALTDFMSVEWQEAREQRRAIRCANFAVALEAVSWAAVLFAVAGLWIVVGAGLAGSWAGSWYGVRRATIGSMQKPSVGRIVQFKPTDSQRAELERVGNPVDPDDWLAAIVVRVWSDTCVNLRVFADGDAAPWVTSAELGEGVYNWRWPPRV